MNNYNVVLESDDEIVVAQNVAAANPMDAAGELRHLVSVKNKQLKSKVTHVETNVTFIFSVCYG